MTSTLCVVVGLLLSGVGIPLAEAAQPAGATSNVRFAHLSPDTPAVDITVTQVAGSGHFELDGVGYGQVSDYRSVPSGSWRVEFRPAGFGTDSAPVLSTVVDAEAGRSYTVAGVGPQAALRVAVLPDEVTVPAPGVAGVRLVNATLGAVELDAPWAPAAAPIGAGRAGAYADVPAGSVTGTVTAAGADPVPLSGTVKAGCSYSQVIEQRNQQLSAQLVKDVCGLAAMPTGAIPAGLGGAVTGPGDPWSAASLVLGGLLIAGGMLLYRRTSASR